MRFFSNPQALWLLLLLPSLWLLAWWARARTRKALVRFGDLFALNRTLAATPWRRSLRRTSLTMGLLLLIVGIAGPQWGRQRRVQTMTGRDIVVVLDLSRSMLAELKPRHLRAVNALIDLADAVERRGGHRLGLIVFAAAPKIVCPLTNDYGHFRYELRQLDANHLPPEMRPRSGAELSGTRIGAALKLAVQLHDPRFEGAQDILLVSDGDDPARDDEWIQGTDAAKQFSIPVDVVGVGDPDLPTRIPVSTGFLHYQGEIVRTKLEEELLKEIAWRTGGTYIPLRTKQMPLGKLYHEVLARRHERRENDERTLPVYQQRYPLFLAPALALLALTMIISARGRDSSKK